MGSESEETIFVAVGKSVERSKPTLSWAIDNFAGKRICLLHVHKPAHSAASRFVVLADGKFVAHKLKENGFKVLQQDVETHEILRQYQVLLAEAGVEADKILIETDDIGKGIVESISSHNIKWLVMGAADNKHYSKNLSTLKSRKAIFVCQNAPDFSNIWFTCKGYLIYTRVLWKNNVPKLVIMDRENDDKPEEDSAPLLLSVTNSHIEATQLECSMPEPVPEGYGQEVIQFQRSRAGKFDYNMRRFNSLILPGTKERRSVVRKCAEAVDGEIQGIVSPRSQCSEDQTRTSELRLLIDKEERTLGSEVHDMHHRLELALIDVKISRKKEFEEAIKRWKEEDNALDAKQNVKSLEISYTKELNERTQLENELKRKRQELEAVKNQHSETIERLHSVQEQKPILENRVSESRLPIGELEEKIMSAVELLIAFKERRDKLRIECEDAMQEVRELRKSVMKSSTFYEPLILSFTFEEIMDATRSYDPSCKIGEGGYGTIYKGMVRHMDVAIRMMPSSFFQSIVDFKHKVELLSRVRHPNLVTLIGTCPESYSLIYEYLGNGSLEGRLTCRGKKTPPFPWQTRILIAAEICSALIFLHSHEPHIVHGNLKPSNILFDSNYVSKISDLGIISFLAAKQGVRSDSNSIYIDPEYLATGELSQGSDVYSLAIILLQLISGRSDLSLVKDIGCAIEKGNFDSVLDVSAGDWPLDEMEQLARLATRCCEPNKLERPNLVSEVWTILELMRDLAINSASRFRSKESRQAPPHFVCPIYQEVMKDPLIAADGFTYEAEAIRGWLESDHNTSPMTNLKLEHTDLVPNYALLYAIQEWQHLL